MNKGIAIVGGLGLGAALMYIFDPDRGKRRRALIRDKVEDAANKVVDSTGKMQRDLSNRAAGLVAETKAILRNEEVADDVLVDRVRSRLGRIPVEIDSLDVTVDQGTVTLRGRILGSDLPRVLRAARYVRGVKALDDRFTVHPTLANAPEVQGQPQPAGAG